MKKIRHDVVVVGGGPAGASAAYWLARAGCDVLMIEKRRYPRDKPCGDALTPRAARQLQDMGLDAKLQPFHRPVGIRLVGYGVSYEHRWAGHPTFPPFGYTVRRTDLVALVASWASKEGASVWEGAEVVSAKSDEERRHQPRRGRPQHPRGLTPCHRCRI